jgi:alpha-L-fucosidase
MEKRLSEVYHDYTRFHPFMLILFILLMSGISSASAQGLPAGKAGSSAHDQKMEWWRDAKFGMFIHWGDYAVLAGVYKGHEIKHGGEWIMNRAKIPVQEYQQYAKQFDPVKFDPDAWVRMAKEAGMKYIVITAKHHDGFAMFNSRASKWNIVDATPYHKDVLKMLAAACKKYNMRLGFYYSQAQDWNNPGGAAARKLATDGWPNPDSTQIDAYTAVHEGHWDPYQTSESMTWYMNHIAIPQVKELLTNYGKVSVLWWDTPVHMTDEYAEKLQALLKLQPGIITNDRLKRPDFPGDYMTPEQHIPESAVNGKDFEVCMTMNGTWGYKSYDDHWKSVKTLVRNLIDIASKGGNYLLNVGPKADGTFPQQSIDILQAMGKWMKVNGQSIYATQKSPLAPLSWGRCTMKGQGGNTVLYLSVFDWPADRQLLVRGLKNEVISAALLSSGHKLKTTMTGDGSLIHVPAEAPDSIASVIRLEVKGRMNGIH